MSVISFTPSQTYEEALRRAAAWFGVDREYWDIWGQLHVIGSEVLQAILRSLGVPCETLEQLNAVLEEELWRHWSTPLSQTLVLRISDATLQLRIPQGYTDGEAQLRIHWEDGDRTVVESRLAELQEQARASLRGETFLSLLWPLTGTDRLGYHQLDVVIHREGLPDICSESRLILCPDRAWLSEELAQGGRLAGVAVSVYGLRSDRNWGCGDTTDLENFCRWAAAVLRAAFVGVNPLHAIANRSPFNTSPYLPLCSNYRNPLYIDVERVPEFQASRWGGRVLASPPVQQLIRELRCSPHVQYERVWRLKRFMLQLAFREWLKHWRRGGERAQQFEKWAAAEGQLLHDYAVYCALDETLRRRNPNLWLWTEWPQPLRDPRSPETAAFARRNWRRVLFYKFVQWVLDEQLAEVQEAARAAGMPIGLYHDLALATDKYGADLWSHREFFVPGCRVGSPPDDFAPKGQDWGFPPPNARRHRADGYQLFAASLRNNMRHGGALRIDHVMRFFRLYWIPDHLDATQGTYVRDFADEALGVLALESVRNQVLIIGEDLGTVEDGIRESLHRHGILSYRVLYFERDESGGFLPPDRYPPQALVTASTHDLPTLAGFWTCRDIEARRQAGLLPDECSYQQQLQARQRDKQLLLDRLHELGFLPSWAPRHAALVSELTGEMHNAVVGFLASTPSMLFVLNQEDLFKALDQQNLPGSTDQYPNWKQKMRYSIEELATSGEARAYAAMFRHWVESTGRAVGSGSRHHQSSSFTQMEPRSHDSTAL
jgi:4-alpha-glucanotransferase